MTMTMTTPYIQSTPSRVIRFVPQFLRQYVSSTLSKVSSFEIAVDQLIWKLLIRFVHQQYIFGSLPYFLSMRWLSCLDVDILQIVGDVIRLRYHSLSCRRLVYILVFIAATVLILAPFLAYCFLCPYWLGRRRRRRCQGNLDRIHCYDCEPNRTKPNHPTRRRPSSCYFLTSYHWRLIRFDAIAAKRFGDIVSMLPQKMLPPLRKQYSTRYIISNACIYIILKGCHIIWWNLLSQQHGFIHSLANKRDRSTIRSTGTHNARQIMIAVFLNS